MEYPLKVLFVVVNRKFVSEVETLLRSFDVLGTTTLMGKGTAGSKVGDLFSFGIIDRDAILTIIPSKMGPEIVLALSKRFEFYKANTGVAFTVPLDAISSDLLDQLKLLI